MISKCRIAAIDPFDSGDDQLNLEPYRLECSAQQLVDLVAPTTSLSAHDLAKSSVRVETNRKTELYVEVFVWDGEGMAEMDAIQTRQIRPDRSGIAYALEIGSEVQRSFGKARVTLYQTQIWMGLTNVAAEADRFEFTGSREISKSIQRWLGLSPFAVQRKLVA